MVVFDYKLVSEFSVHLRSEKQFTSSVSLDVQQKNTSKFLFVYHNGNFHNPNFYKDLSLREMTKAWSDTFLLLEKFDS
jgi:hypothetical protein